MSDELERLRADLEVIERYSSYSVIENARCDIADKIKRIENPDPWQNAKKDIENNRSSRDERSIRVIAYVDHLTAENERLAKRVAELESIAVWGIHSQVDGHLIKAFESEAEADAELADYVAKQTTRPPHFLEVKVSNAREIVKAIRGYQEFEKRFRDERDGRTSE